MICSKKSFVKPANTELQTNEMILEKGEGGGAGGEGRVTLDSSPVPYYYLYYILLFFVQAPNQCTFLFFFYRQQKACLTFDHVK